MPEPEVIPEATPEVKVEPDLITRVSQVKAPEQAKKELDDKFNINDLDAQIEKLPDPTLKEQVLGLKKSLLKGENQKYQEIANLRKQYEQRLSEVSTWTPDRLKQEMNKPDFVQAAQEYLNTTQPQQEYSGLSEPERMRIKQAEEMAKSAQAQLYQLQQNQIHTGLRSKYANYDPTTISQDLNELMTGKISNDVFIESVWKARDYEAAVRRAYELGLQDRNSQNQERASGMTYETGRNMPQPTGVERQKGESNQQFMLRSYAEHAKKK